MSAWTCLLGWFRFTVPDSSAEEMIARVGGEWGVRSDRHGSQLGPSGSACGSLAGAHQ